MGRKAAIELQVVQTRQSTACSDTGAAAEVGGVRQVQV